MITHAFVQYCFDSEEHSVSVRPHGNSKKKRNFYESTKKLKIAARNLTPKFAVCEVSSAVGGIMTVPSAGTIPRNRLQVSNLRRRSGSGTEDPFIRLVRTNDCFIL